MRKEGTQPEGCGYRWSRIASIEYVGYEQVYDIEVEGTHNFIANGIVAHNTYINGALTATGAISGSNLSGTNTGDQTITLTGDVTGSGTGSFATTISADAVALGTDTTGNYVGDVASGSGITVSGTAGEGYTETVKLGGALTDASTSLTHTSTAANDPLVGITLTPNAGTNVTQNVLKIASAITTTTTDTTVDSLVYLDNADTSASGSTVVTDAIKITSSGMDGGVVDAIDVSDANITNAINIGANNIVTAAATIASTELDRLDGKDAALVDVNDAVNTAITGVGTLGSLAVSGATSTDSLTVGGGYGSTGVSISTDGNLQVDGNIYLKGTVWRENLQELLVKNNTITLNDGGSAQDAFIKVSATNGQIKWNNTASKWQLTNDGTNFYDIANPYTAGDGLDLASQQFSVDVTDIIGAGLAEDASNNLILASTTAGSGLTYTNGVLAVGAGSGITVAADSVAHTDTSSLANVDNTGGTVLQDVTVDTFGHLTGVTSYDLDGRYYTETESDTNFVNITGDTITGPLVIGDTTGADSLTLNNAGTADGTTTTYDSQKLVLEGSYWDGGQAQDSGFTLFNDTTGNNAYKLSILDKTGTNEIAYLDQAGNLYLDGQISASQIVGTLSGNIDADQVNAGSFQNSLYTFPNNVEVTGTGTFATISTGLGQTEVYLMDQNVRSTDAVTFVTVNTGHGANELYAMDQAVRTSDSPTFAGATLNGNASIRSADRIILDSDDTADSYIAHSNANNYVSLYIDGVECARIKKK